MLDINLIRNNPKQLEDLLKARGILDANPVDLISLDDQRKKIIALIQKLQEQRNLLAKRRVDQNSEKDLLEVQTLARKLNEDIAQNQELLASVTLELNYLMDRIPNFLEEDVPFGTSEQDNKIISRWGEERIQSVTNKIHHLQIATDLGGVELNQTVKMSGSRFVSFIGALAELKRALINFMIDVHTKDFGFCEISPPYIVKEKAMYHSGQLPKFDEDSFVTTKGHRLIPTAEVPLVNFVADKIVALEKLPIRLVSVTPCFRSEAGSAGKDTKGIIRLHQFTKVELVSITDSQNSKEEHKFLLEAASSILKRLELPHQTVLLCSWDTGFASQKTYDLEVWMPEEQKYREISSCSNCGDFQARRMNARYKANGMNLYLHTLNASGLAIERTIAAILENYFFDDVLHVPSVLQPYLKGQTTIKCQNIQI
jgi:seryl-tRNA synthetase